MYSFPDSEPSLVGRDPLPGSSSNCYRSDSAHHLLVLPSDSFGKRGHEQVRTVPLERYNIIGFRYDLTPRSFGFDSGYDMVDYRFFSSKKCFDLETRTDNTKRVLCCSWPLLYDARTAVAWNGTSFDNRTEEGKSSSSRSQSMVRSLVRDQLPIHSEILRCSISLMGWRERLGITSLPNFPYKMNNDHFIHISHFLPFLIFPHPD